jgi:APA family basic amino acid/polyamine antiporter
LLDATTLVMGSMIGSGIFLVSAESSRVLGSPGWLLMAWALAGLLTITGAVSSGEVAAMMPHAGGQYVILRETYGRPIGFLFGWAMFVVIQSGTIAAVSVAFAKFLGVFAERVAEDNYIVQPIVLGKYALSLSTQQLVAMAVIASLTFFNSRGLRIGALIQNTFTITKTAALIGLIVVGRVGVNKAAAAFTSAWWNPAANGWTLAGADKELAALGVTGSLAFVMLLGKAMIGPLFSQTAWNSVTFTGAETKNPERVLPRALVLGTSSVVTLYMLANVGYILTLSLNQIQHAEQDRVGTATMGAVLGDVGVKLMAGAILISTFGCVNGLVLSGARIYYAMAQDGLFFKSVGTTNRFQVPAVGLLIQGIWAAALTLPRTVTVEDGVTKFGNLYGDLLAYVIPADLMFYTLLVGAVIVLRITRPSAARPFLTPAYPFPPLLYVVLAVLLIVDLLVVAPSTSGMGFLIVLTGIPIYLVWARKGVGAPSTAGQPKGG